MSASGTAVLDFGAFPGASDTSVAVTGQGAIIAGSSVEAWLRLEATADHSADEHLVETIKVMAGNIVAGTGFTIYGINSSELFEPVGELRGATLGGIGTRIYGTWTCSWVWA